MRINENVIYDYYFCKYKAFLKYHQTEGFKHNLVQLEEKQIAEKESYIFSKIMDGGSILNLKNKNTFKKYFTQFYDLIQNATFSNKNFKINVHLKNRINSKELGNLYSPVFFVPSQTIKKEHKLFVTSCMLIIEKHIQNVTHDCLVYCLNSNNPLKVQMKYYKKETEFELKEIFKVVQKAPLLYLSNNCPLCEYRVHCDKLAKEQDNLSLIKGLGVKEIKKLNNKGIFTVHQYSFTFRPRKKRKKNTIFLKKHHHALQALAIRTNKTYIYSTTKIPISKNKIFIDIEFLPEDKYPYLIGMVIMMGTKMTQHSIWIDEKDVYKNKVELFLEIVGEFKDFQIYHYGQSEYNFFNSILKLDIKYKVIIEKIIAKSVNVLALIYGNIYFPTYSNSLKNIANYLGFNWSSQNTSGLDAIYWRKYWLKIKCDKTKEKLIQYNIEDCLALKVVTSFIFSAFKKDFKKYKNINTSVDESEDLPSRYGAYDFGSQKFFLEDFEHINKCAYFDYQRNKVFIRTHNSLVVKKKRCQKNSIIPINKKISINSARVCPKCKSKNLRTAIRKDSKKRIVLDLLYFKGGIKRWNVEYESQYQNCQHCRNVFLPQKFLDTKGKYGHNLISWLLYQNIANWVSYSKIAATLKDVFQYDYLYNFRDISKTAFKFYSLTNNSLKYQILKGDIIHIDETRVNTINGKGYVWIFTNMNTVYYLFRNDRKTDFLKDLLKNFKGVLISDFYKGYDSLDCKHQKCLIHLMRDVNKLSFKNQQDETIKQFATDFGKLLRVIIDTIDKYGLKTWHLNKHKKEVNNFYKNVKAISTKNTEFQTLINRFIKYQASLFMFLNLDGIPWNNNNAEHGFTHFAIYRRQANGLFSEQSIERYLCFLSIYQTCSYRKVSFLHFLRSKEKFIRNYQEKYNKDGNKKKPIAKYQK